MSIASRITEMETHIGNAYTSIDNLGIDISNTNKNIYNFSTLLDTLYERLPKVSGIGASLSLSPSMVGKIKLNGLYGQTNQASQPSPSSPVPIESVTGLQNVEVCGKNLWSSEWEQGYINANGINENANNIIRTKDYISVIPNQHYAIKRSITGDYINVRGYDKNKNFVGGGGDVINLIDGASTTNPMIGAIDNCVISPKEGVYYLRFNDATNDLSTKYMMVKGDTPTSYEPYNGNTYEVNLGKNLLNIQGIVKGRLDNGVIGYESDTSELTLNDNSFSFTTTKNYRGVTSDYINVEENETYIYSMSTIYNQIGIVVAYYDINKVFISDYNVAASAEYKSFTTPNNSCYIRMYFYRNNASSVTIENPQLEKGSIATTYAPYFTPIELNKIGDYEDFIFKNEPNNPNYDSNLTLNSWYIHKEFGKAIFDNITWDSAGHQASGYRRYYTNTIPNVKYVSSNTELGVGLAEKYSIHKGQGMGSYGAENCFAIDVSIVQAVDTQTPTGYLIYLLATPTTTEITNTTLIEQLETLYEAKSKDGTTNINVTSEDLSMILNVGVLKGDAE